jgi:hypothetical protein
VANHAWWVNRKDAEGDSLFEGGFLGLDTIGVFDRSAPLPTGGTIEQADGTAWMAGFSLTMFRIAVELAEHNRVYQDMAVKYHQHFLLFRSAMDRMGAEGTSLWDDEDGFFYDALRFADGRRVPLRVLSMVGLLSLTACEVVQPEQLERLPRLRQRILDPTLTGATSSCSTSTSTATTAPDSARATRPGGPGSLPASSRCCATSTHRRCWREPRSASDSGSGHGRECRWGERGVMDEPLPTTPSRPSRIHPWRVMSRVRRLVGLTARRRASTGIAFATHGSPIPS